MINDSTILTCPLAYRKVIPCHQAFVIDANGITSHLQHDSSSYPATTLLEHHMRSDSEIEQLTNALEALSRHVHKGLIGGADPKVLLQEGQKVFQAVNEQLQACESHGVALPRRGAGSRLESRHVEAMNALMVAFKASILGYPASTVL